MLHPAKKKKHQAIAWLENFSQELDGDPEILEHLSDEDVQAELRAWGADVQGFHTTLAKKIRAAKLRQVGVSLTQWISTLWQPQWVGQFVGAGDIPRQTHSFELEQGRIDVSCAWTPQQGATPAYLDLSWNADIRLEGTLFCRFIQPETQEVLAEFPLGDSKEGGHYFTSSDLGFDPSLEKWALAILVKRAQHDSID